jgi:hypothetical protein
MRIAILLLVLTASCGTEVPTTEVPKPPIAGNWPIAGKLVRDG